MPRVSLGHGQHLTEQRIVLPVCASAASAMLSRAFEHKAGFVHGFALLVLAFIQYDVGP